MDGTRADHYEKTVVGLGYAADGFAAAAKDGFLGFGGLECFISWVEDQKVFREGVRQAVRFGEGRVG